MAHANPRPCLNISKGGGNDKHGYVVIAGNGTDLTSVADLRKPVTTHRAGSAAAVYTFDDARVVEATHNYAVIRLTMRHNQNAKGGRAKDSKDGLDSQQIDVTLTDNHNNPVVTVNNVDVDIVGDPT